MKLLVNDDIIDDGLQPVVNDEAEDENEPDCNERDSQSVHLASTILKRENDDTSPAANERK